MLSCISSFPRPARHYEKTAPERQIGCRPADRRPDLRAVGIGGGGDRDCEREDLGNEFCPCQIHTRTPTDEGRIQILSWAINDIADAAY